MTLYQYLIRTSEDIYVLSRASSIVLKVGDDGYLVGERGRIEKVITVVV